MTPLAEQLVRSALRTARTLRNGLGVVELLKNALVAEGLTLEGEPEPPDGPPQSRMAKWRERHSGCSLDRHNRHTGPCVAPSLQPSQQSVTEGGKGGGLSLNSEEFSEERERGSGVTAIASPQASPRVTARPSHEDPGTPVGIDPSLAMSDESRAYAEQFAVQDIELEWSSFVNWCRSAAKLSADFQALWRSTWVPKAAKRQRTEREAGRDRRPYLAVAADDPEERRRRRKADEDYVNREIARLEALKKGRHG